MRLRTGRCLALALALLLSVGGQPAAQATRKPEILYTIIAFEPGERTLSPAALSALASMVAKMDAMCGPDWGERSWATASYRIPGRDWPPADMQLIGERVEAMERWFMQFSPGAWSTDISASQGILDFPMPAGRDHLASIRMYCGL